MVEPNTRSENQHHEVKKPQRSSSMSLIKLANCGYLQTLYRQVLSQSDVDTTAFVYYFPQKLKDMLIGLSKFL